MLTYNFAQQIVDRMMKVIPYNVNIMDHRGVIIASGDSLRVGKVHRGAFEAIERGILIEVYNSSGGAKPGVNMPIYYNNEIVGVIGISGNPKVVGPFAELVKITAELLISQEYTFKEKRMEERLKDEFLHQWAYLNQEYDLVFKERAKVLNINLNIERVAVIVKSIDSVISPKFDKLRIKISKDEYLIRLNPQTCVMFIKFSNNMEKLIEGISSLIDNVYIGIGFKQDIVGLSVKQAFKSIELGERLKPNQYVYNYKEFVLIHRIYEGGDTKKILKPILKLIEEGVGSDLINTLDKYINLNGEINLVAESLHIHRNSLNYRLQKIQDITGKNTKNYLELFQLFSAYTIYKLGCKEVNNIIIN